ncbi:MAG: S-methyl-5'-thioadenosine phosphorylase [Planctomycetota bacterium]
MPEIGIIGGSGLYAMDGFTAAGEVAVQTPFGSPSDAIMVGDLEGVEVAFLPRHGRGHRVNPSEVNYRANIHAMKSVGVRYLISVTAVGSMREEIVPGDLVLIDQFIDRTRGRAHTFFEDGIAAHVSFAEPLCEAMRGIMTEAARELDDVNVHTGGTYVCMEGPAFSTRAESLLYRSWGARVIGMTNLTEAKLAREAEIAMQTIALATDYDCWRESEAEVSVEEVVRTLGSNVEKAKRLLRAAVPKLAAARPTSKAHTALVGAIMTDPQAIPPAVRERLALLIKGRLRTEGSEA